MTKNAVVLLWILSVASVSSSLAGGCPPMPTWEEVRENAGILFSGHLIGEREHRTLPGLPWLRFPEWVGFGESQWTYEFETEGWWKGNVPRKVSLTVAPGNLFPVYDDHRRMVIEAEFIRGAVFTVPCGFSYPIWTPSQADSVLVNDPFAEYQDYFEYGFVVTEDSLSHHFGELSKASFFGSIAYHPALVWILLAWAGGMLFVVIRLCRRAITRRTSARS